MSNPFLDRLKAQGKNPHGKKSEKRLVQSIAGGRLTPNSGSMRGAKSDATVDRPKMEFRLEAKSTVHDSISILRVWLVKVTTEALSSGRTPALAVSFVDVDGKPKHNGDWVMIPKWAFEELTE